MLETIREYAWEQLGSYNEAECVQRAHAAYFTVFAERREFADLLTDHFTAVHELEAERDNLRSALAYLAGSSETAEFLRLVAALGSFWLSQANYQEGAVWFEQALLRPASDEPVAHAKIQVQQGMSTLFQGNIQMAGAHLQRGVDECRNHEEHHYSALGLIGLAGAALDAGAYDGSNALLNEALHHAESIKDARLSQLMEGWVSINLATVSRRSGNHETAETHIRDALEHFQSRDFQVGIMMAHGDLGDLAKDQGHWEEALAYYRESLTIGRTNPSQRIVIEVIESVADVYARVGRLEPGATLLGASRAWRERIGLGYRHPGNRAAFDTSLATLRAGLPEPQFGAAWARGRNLAEESAIELALSRSDRSTAPNESRQTDREYEILQFLATGMTDPEIADALFISVRTVEHHVSRLFRKLEVRTRTAAVSTAIASGLVVPVKPEQGLTDA